MDNCLRLSPPISIATVKRLRKDDFFEIQVIPSFSAKSSTEYSNELYISPLKQYLLRRKYEDFEELHKRVTLANVTVPFPDKRVAGTQLIIELNEFIEKLFALPFEIIDKIPINLFFGEWIQDQFEKRPLLTSDLMGLDKNDEVLASILQIDNDMRVSGVSLSRSSSTKSTVDATFSNPTNLESKRNTIVPTYEEFVAQLAAKYLKPTDSRDTIIDETHPVTLKDSSRESIRDTIRDSMLLLSSTRASTQSIKTILSDTVPLKKSEENQSNLINTNQHIQYSSTGSEILTLSRKATILIPSRNESRNWSSSESPLALNSASSPLSVYGEHDLEGGPKKDILTIKIIPVSGSYSKIKVSLNLTYAALLEKLCLVVGVKSMNQLRISYRDFDNFDNLIVIADKEAWEICLEGLGDREGLRLNLFLNPK